MIFILKSQVGVRCFSLKRKGVISAELSMKILTFPRAKLQLIWFAIWCQKSCEAISYYPETNIFCKDTRLNLFIMWGSLRKFYPSVLKKCFWMVIRSLVSIDLFYETAKMCPRQQFSFGQTQVSRHTLYGMINSTTRKYCLIAFIWLLTHWGLNHPHIC